MIEIALGGYAFVVTQVYQHLAECREAITLALAPGALHLIAQGIADELIPSENG